MITQKPVGYTEHGRKLVLFTETRADGTQRHSLRVEPRRHDETVQLLEGLTTENLVALGQVAGVK